MISEGILGDAPDGILVNNVREFPKELLKNVPEISRRNCQISSTRKDHWKTFLRREGILEKLSEEFLKELLEHLLKEFSQKLTTEFFEEILGENSEDIPNGTHK